jgi:hypothetical protein
VVEGAHRCRRLSAPADDEDRAAIAAAADMHECVGIVRVTGRARRENENVWLVVLGGTDRAADVEHGARRQACRTQLFVDLPIFARLSGGHDEIDGGCVFAHTPRGETPRPCKPRFWDTKPRFRDSTGHFAHSVTAAGFVGASRKGGYPAAVTTLALLR